MALHLYLDPACTNQISEGTGLNPDSCEGSGTTGFVNERKIYLKNNDPAKDYKGVSITAYNDDANVDIKYAPDASGAPGTYADSLVLPDILDATTVITIWRKVTVAAGQAAQNRVNIKHRVSATEYAS